MDDAHAHRVDRLLIGEPDPFPALEPREPAPPRPSAPAAPPREPAPEAEARLDPLLISLDRFVALTVYVLLFLSVFMLGVPALAGAALAYVHRPGSHPVVHTHFTFQLRVFWSAALLMVLALVAAVAGAGAGLLPLAVLAQEHLSRVPAILPQDQLGLWSGVAAGALIAGAALLLFLAVLWILVASVTGFLRLLSGRPIGHSPQT